jgi:hypothetical protein
MHQAQQPRLEFAETKRDRLGFRVGKPPCGIGRLFNGAASTQYDNITTRHTAVLSAVLPGT